MNRLIIVALIFLTSSIIACSENQGGGIAGGSWDSKNTIAEVNSYKSYISPLLSETIIENKCCGTSKDTWAGISQHFDDILRSFAINLNRLDEREIELKDFSLKANFKNHELLVLKSEKIIIKENLPSVFVMHPMRMGIDKLSGVSVIMVVNKSRASTGRYFVAIYKLDGTPLYKNVLSTGQVWDIKLEKNHIDILGCGETRRIILLKA